MAKHARGTIWDVVVHTVAVVLLVIWFAFEGALGIGAEIDEDKDY